MKRRVGLRRPRRLSLDLVLVSVQVNRAAAMQDVSQPIAIYAHAVRGLLERQTFTHDQADGCPVQSPLGSFVVAHP